MHRVSSISFPGLGIGEFQIDGTAISFQIGNTPITIMWYGIIICLGIFLGFAYFAYRAREKGLSFDDILDITLVTVLVAIAGARLYFLIFYGGFLATGGSFWQNVKDTLYNIVAVWEGGLAIYGGVIGGFFALLFMSKRKKQPLFRLTDATVPGVMIGQLVGRWGNFCNGEAFGAETTLPWRMGLNNALTGYRTIYVHPTFLYESLWNLVGFLIINAFYKKKKYDGEVTLWYFAWYGFGRGFIELLRTDSLYIGSLRVSSLLSFAFVAVIVPAWIVFCRRYKSLVAAGAIEKGEVTSFAVLLKKGRASTLRGAGEPAEAEGSCGETAGESGGTEGKPAGDAVEPIETEGEAVGDAAEPIETEGEAVKNEGATVETEGEPVGDAAEPIENEGATVENDEEPQKSEDTTSASAGEEKKDGEDH